MTPENTFWRNISGRRCVACTNSYRSPSRLASTAARMARRIAAIAAVAIFSVAQAAVVTSTVSEVFLYRSSTKLSPAHVDMAACVAAARSLAAADHRTSGVVTYTCKGAQSRVIATYSANPPPPVCPPQPAAESRTVTCEAPLVGSWNQSRSYASAPAPTCWIAGAWLPTAAPAGACTSVPPPPPPPTGTFPPQLLNFAETWDRNWNFGGHAVDARFDGNYGNWDYTETTYEPWLFDRASVGYYLYEATGLDRWRAKFLSDFTYYRTHIDAQGIFTPKGSGDTKYGYVTPFVLYERLTGDAQYQPIAKRIYDAWIREWPDVANLASASLWTEREIAFALEAAVGWYDLTGDPAALARANALVLQWTTVSGAAGAPLVTYTKHEGGGPGGTTPTELVNSPWMSALYFQAARRLHEETGNTDVLQQASRYFDWLDNYGFYDGSLAHVEFTGVTFPRYLTPSLIGDGGYDEGNMAHALDVAGMVKFAIYAKTARGEPTAAAQARLAQMAVTADRDFANWTRTTTYLPRYRISPPRKFNWQVRGARELAR